MRHIHRIVLLVGLVALGPVLAGCADFDMDKLDVFGLSDKKKLPGDRKPLFPEGVPGVSQGIPPEYRQGYQPPPDSAQTPSVPENAAEAGKKKTAAVEPADEPKPKPKRKPKPRTTAQPAAPAQQPWPASDQQQPQQAQTPWPGQGQGTGGAPYPAAPAPGTFSR